MFDGFAENLDRRGRRGRTPGAAWRLMAGDVTRLLGILGHQQFAVVGHDKPEQAIMADPDAWYGGDPAQMASRTSRTIARGWAPDQAADVADREAGRRIECPTMVLWSSGHHMAEDAPHELSARLIAFLA